MRSVSATLLCAVLSAGLVAAPTSAFAQVPERTAQEEAQQYFEKGAALYFAGKYADALVQFKKGEDTYPNALFLYNIAMCNLRLDRYQEAMTAAQSAKTMGGLGKKEATLNLARIAAIGRIQHSISRTEDIKAAKQAKEARKHESLVSKNSTNAPKVYDTPKHSGIGFAGWSGIILTVAGVGLLGASVPIDLSLQKKWDDYRKAAADKDRVKYDQLASDIKDQQSIGKIFVLSGAGLTAIGVGLIIAATTDHSSEGRRGARLYVMVDGLGATAGFHF